MAHDSETDPDVPVSVAIQAVRCPDCGMIHVALFDEDDNPVTEMTLGDEDILRMALQFLKAVNPKIDLKTLMASIRLANVDTAVKQ